MEVPLVYLITNPIWLGWVDAVTVCFTFHAHTQSSLLWWSLPGPMELIQLIKANKGIWLGLLHILAWLYLLASRRKMEEAAFPVYPAKFCNSSRQNTREANSTDSFKNFSPTCWVQAHLVFWKIQTMYIITTLVFYFSYFCYLVILLLWLCGCVCI